ncbi:Bifunctional solanapyrone synthase [Mycena sanguinolenta]|uniref:Bifunctional solanapyrone synthase n=1 Tax=Mycena sanguinolenta TaxID=230812 RepID=A0A8H7CI57_9AGAR|nr:Bifunctional solanapyrone synthase [Mycena sanguinolenta]
MNLRGLLKSGGHISVPKIYPGSKEGVIIYMRQFKHIHYDEEKKTLDVGAGVIWKDVYKYLEPFVSAASDDAPGVVGGDPLVGVSGWLLGGGYSLLTNKFGLGIDNIVGFRVLLPGAKAVCPVNAEENHDIFEALKGGGHNFGIITQFTLRVHKQAKRASFPWCSIKDFLIRFIRDEARPEEAVVVAAFRHDLEENKLKSFIPLTAWNTDISFCQNTRGSETRELAQLSLRGGDNLSGSDAVQAFGSQSQGPPSMSLAEAYEAFSLRNSPVPVSLKTLQANFHSVNLEPSSEIGRNILNADLIDTKLFTSLQIGNKIERDSLTVFAAGNSVIASLESPPDLRGRMACIMVTTYTRTLIDEAENSAKRLSLLMAANHGIRVSFEIWPFHKNAFNGVRQGQTAWPHVEGKVFGPLVGWFEWSGKKNDEFWLKKVANSLEELHKVALQENCTTEDLPKYLNLTLENTPVKDIYRDNYEKLKSLRRKYDTQNVMGLAAGFVIDAGEA